jgi:glutathione S-transferase
MITVHHLNNSRSQRVLWLLEELGVEYEIKKYERDPRTMLAPPALRDVHPLGKSPVITDGDITVAESGAILEYLVEKYDDGSLAPAVGTPERLRWRYWMHFAEGSAMPPLLLKLIFDKVGKSPMPFLRNRLHARSLQRRRPWWSSRTSSVSGISWNRNSRITNGSPAASSVLQTFK